MILYLDTSSLVKMYVEEKGSEEVFDLVSSSKASATSLVAYAEARSAFARRFRENAFSSTDYAFLKSTWDKDWENYLLLPVTNELVTMSGDLAERYGLRGFDAIHLSSAVSLKNKLPVPIVFSCFDEKLQKASELEGFGQP